METDLAHHFIEGLLGRMQSETAAADRRAARLDRVLARSAELRAEIDAEIARIAAQRKDRQHRSRSHALRDTLD